MFNLNIQCDDFSSASCGDELQHQVRDESEACIHAAQGYETDLYILCESEVLEGIVARRSKESERTQVVILVL